MRPDYTAGTKSTEWGTPQALFDELNEEFHFKLDACANAENAKCPVHFTLADNALWQEWASHESVFMNPPYGPHLADWVQKAWEESQRGCTVVCLLPARTDLGWFHDYCLNGEIRFIRGRLRFEGAKYNAPFPSMLVIFRPPGGD